MRIRLKDLRTAHKMYQSEFAAILGTTQSSVSRLEYIPVVDISSVYYKNLCNKFGKEEVDSYIVDDNVSIVIRGNKNQGSGQQTNSVVADSAALGIIKQQSDMIHSLLEKQAEQNDRLLRVLEKLANNDEKHQ